MIFTCSTAAEVSYELQQHNGLRWETVAWHPTNSAAQQDFHVMCGIWKDRAHRVVFERRIQIFSDPRSTPCDGNPVEVTP